ncbi:MAG: FHA domain-containing protein [Thermoleophilaceae bacterium]
MEAFSAGTLAGAGSFRCQSCGFAIALQELDAVPSCPDCGGREFRRSSLFSRPSPRETAPPVEGRPGWLGEARDALAEPGAYIAFEDDERVHVLPLQEGWTRIGRSLSAHVRFDDPTVSRRHALVYREDGGARILDDRSLNGVYRNGDRVELAELEDGDEIGVGRFRLFFMSLAEDGSRSAEGAATTVG